MSKIARKLQKIFGSTSGLDQIATYGSLAAGSPAFTLDPDVIQSLSQYLDGWFSAVIGGNSPAIEDMNALCYLFAYQLAYLMQAGVPEYNAATTYYFGSLVNGGDGVTYVSVVNNNTGNALTDNTKWFIPTQLGAVIQQNIASNLTLTSGKTFVSSQTAIGSGVTVTVPNSARMASEGSIIVTGTGALVVTGTGVARAF